MTLLRDTYRLSSDKEVPWPDAGTSCAGKQPFKLLGRVMKAHARVIWACSWAPDDRSFATGARDSLVKVWTMGSGSEGMAPCQPLGMNIMS